MRLLISTIMIILVSFVACIYLPWWTIAIVSFLMAIFIAQRPFLNFVSGFTGIFLLWGALAFWMSTKNEHILAHKISLIILKSDHPLLLIFLTALIGGIVAGIAALSGGYLRSLVFGDTNASIVSDL